MELVQAAYMMERAPWRYRPQVARRTEAQLMAIVGAVVSAAATL
jgi:hypothetical protein